VDRPSLEEDTMRRLPALIVGLLLGSTLPATAATAPREAPASGRIRAAELMKTVEWLAAPGRHGRLAGGPGYMSAAREMARRFRGLGLRPGGEDGFFERLDVEHEQIDSCALALVDADGVAHPLRLGPDFVCRGLSGSGDVTAPVVFAGYGVSRPESGYDDYAGLDARGRIVLVLKPAPPFRLDTLGWGESLLPRPRARVAAAHGAKGLLLVAADDPEGLTKPIGSVLEGEGPRLEGFPSMVVDLPVAEELLAGGGPGLAAVKAAIDSTRQPRSRELVLGARMSVRARYDARRPSVNVVGLLPGADPALRGQAVVVGAHLDHVGEQAGLLFPGANDNASGAAAVLALADAFARGGVRPRRTVVFALFSSEESGLFGAKRFVERPPVPLDHVVAMLNLDCVGVGDSIQLGSGKTSPKLWQLARDLDAGGRRLSVADTWGGGGADATPFAERHVPTLYFASKFSYPHLHRPDDTPDTLAPPLYEALVRLAYRTAWAVADGGYAGE
jgi:aminopeptidase YwaD